MFKLATTITNPGEPDVESRFLDPMELKALGYTGQVLYETTGLSGVPGPETIRDVELRRWVQHTVDAVGRGVERAREAGLDVYLFCDLLVLARDLVDRNVAGLTCKNRPDTLCPASEGVYKHAFDALEAMLQRWPAVTGIMLRFGDTDAQRMPHLMGNDVYSPHCPRCSQFSAADRVVQLLKQAYELIVKKHGKRLIARAWNVRPQGMHDAPELAKRIVDRLPGDPADDRFVLSFKFTQTDFWRYQPWNASSLICGDRPIIYELQCQREFEGKGGIPNWQVPLWRDGYPESAGKSSAHGLADAASQTNLVGLFAWVRGGGWGGPFVRDETWIDANAFAVPLLADDLKADPAKIARQWVEQRLQIDSPSTVEAILNVLQASPEMIRQAFYLGAFAEAKPNSWHPAADWVQDDVLDAGSAWRMVQRVDENKLDDLVREKEQAVASIASARHALQTLAADRNHPRIEKLVNSLLYAESLFEAMRDLISGLVAYRRYQKSQDSSDADMTRRKLFGAQSHWNHHTQRYGSAPGSASPFRETRFWELTQDILAQVS